MENDPPEAKRLGLNKSEALAEIERFTGSPMPPVPDQVSGEEAGNIGWLAQAVRDGGFTLRMKSAKATMDSPSAAAFPSTGRDIEVQETMLARIFGEEVRVAQRVIQLPLMTVRNRVRVGPDSWQVELIPLQTDEIEVCQRWDCKRSAVALREMQQRAGWSIV